MSCGRLRAHRPPSRARERAGALQSRLLAPSHRVRARAMSRLCGPTGPGTDGPRTASSTARSCTSGTREVVRQIGPVRATRGGSETPQSHIACALDERTPRRRRSARCRRIPPCSGAGLNLGLFSRGARPHTRSPTPGTGNGSSSTTARPTPSGDSLAPWRPSGGLPDGCTPCPLRTHKRRHQNHVLDLRA